MVRPGPYRGKTRGLTENSAEDALRTEFALANLADCDQLATGCGVGFAFGNRRIPPTHEDRIAHLQPVCLVVVDDEMRQRRKRFARVDQKGVQCSKSLVRVLDCLERDEIGKRHHCFFGKGRNKTAAQAGDVAIAAEFAAKVAGQRPDIGALAAFDFEMRCTGIRAGKQRETEDFNLTGGDFDGLAVTRQIIGALAGDLDRGELRRNLTDNAGILRQEIADLLLARALVGA